VKLHVRGPAHLALALGIAGLGVACLVYGDFVPQWQPVPPWFPWRHGFAYASGVVLLAGGIGLLVPRLASRAALALAVYQAIWFAAEAQRGAGSGLTSVARWLGFFEGVAEALAAAVGCFTLYTLLVGEGARPRLALVGSRRSRRALEILFGASCVAFGLSHFAYADFTAGMIPHWLPARTALAYLTGVCHIAAGLAIITTLFARLAATLEAVMLGLFVLVVHLPSFASSPRWAPSRQIQWTELCLAVLIAGSAGIVAMSLRDRPWRWRR
jgi:uncharacterized membrane protein